MRTFSNTIGIDISKEKLDAHDYKSNKHHVFKNSTEGFEKLLAFVKKNNANHGENVVYCFENTGIYSLPLSAFMEENKQAYSALCALEIKRSIGIARGKNDKIDAFKIAEYAYLRREKLPLTTLPSAILLQLKDLLSLRARMVKQRGGYQAYLKELSRFSKREKQPLIFESQEKMIDQLSNQIKRIEQEITLLIESEPNLKYQYQLVTSVKGVGLIVGASLLVYTDSFTKFKTWRHFASYAGTAPFPYESGSSIKRGKKVSNMANKTIKALLTNSAVSIIQHDKQMRLYYERRTKDGKNKMSVQNIVKNKLLARVFAVVKRGTPYVNTLGYAA